MSLRSYAIRALTAAFFASFIGASCGQTALGVVPSVINDPANRSIRKSVLEFGTKRACIELAKRSIPLRLRDEDPAIGRFFPKTCASSELQTGELAIRFGGFGYAWSNLTQRMTFEVTGQVDYDTDFLMDGSTMYAYFRKRSANGVSFATRLVEQPVSASILGLSIAGGQGFADAFGSQLLQDQLARGFTVIRDAGGTTELGAGLIAPGDHPPTGIKADRHVMINDRSELHQNQRDFVGPFDVGSGDSLTMLVTVDGAPAVDVIVVPQQQGEAWIQTYMSQAAPAPLPTYAGAPAPPLDDVVMKGTPLKRQIKVPGGRYYMVLDNTSTAGRTPAGGVAMVSYALALD